MYKSGGSKRAGKAPTAPKHGKKMGISTAMRQHGAKASTVGAGKIR